jgi:hypothetical protein
MKPIAAVALMVVLTAGCASGTSPHGGPGPSEALSPPATSAAPPVPSPSSTQVTRPSTAAPVLVTATATPWQDGDPPPPPHTTCGHAALGGENYAQIASGAASLRCFGNAVARCSSASVSYVKFGVDSGNDVVATVLPGTSCHVRYVVEGWTANGGGMTWPADTLDCGASRTADVVVLRCPGFEDRLPVA